MLKIQNAEHFDKVITLIAENDHWEVLLEDLEENLKYLHGYGGDRFDVLIGWDWAPLSFSLEWVNAKTGAGMWPGGLIFHPGGAVDGTLSVELCPRDKPHWSVHT